MKRSWPSAIVALAIASSWLLGGPPAMGQEASPPPTAAASASALPPSGAPLPTGLGALPQDVRDRLTPEQLHDFLMAQQGGSEPPAVAIAVPVAFFLVTLLIVAAALYAGYRKDRQRHETLRLAIERGADIPPALLVPPTPPKSDLRRGVLLVSVGLALAVLLLAVSPAPGVWTAALIPLSLGLGYLIVHRLEGRPPTDVASAGGPPSYRTKVVDS